MNDESIAILRACEVIYMRGQRLLDLVDEAGLRQITPEEYEARLASVMYGDDRATRELVERIDRELRP